MRRQLTVILFLAIVLTALASSLVVAVLSYQKMDANARDSISGVHAQLRDRFRTFDLVLAEEEKELDTHLEQVLPKVAAELTTLPGGPRGASAEHLDRLCSRYEVGYIYVINREGIVVNTNFAPDLNLDLAHAGEAMRNLLERLYGSGKVFADRFNASIHTGRMHKYVYFGPEGEDYIVEVSVDLRDYLSQTNPQVDGFLFQDLFDLSDNHLRHVREFDVYIATDYGGWSLISDGRPLAEDALENLTKTGQRRYEYKDQGTMVVYEQLPRLAGDLGETDTLITKVSYDISSQRDLLYASVGLAMLVALIFGGAAFWLSRNLVNHRLLRPVSQISGHLAGASQGDLKPMSATGVPELDVITRGVNAMLGQISDREDRLLDAQRQLETRVNERTAELEAANRQLAELATTDSLTGLANRRSFFEAAEREYVRARRLGTHLVMAMLDMDNFKAINDSHGHATGDEVLQAVTAIMQRELRESDLAGRLGGEEFAILLVGTTLTHAHDVIERIRTKVAGCDIGCGKAASDIEGHISVSVGLAPWNVHSEDLRTVLVRADKALYCAKRNGRNRVEITASC